METLLKWIRRYVSPVFLVLLLASFILWYIAKLSYTYTTEQTVRISIADQPLEIPCVVEGTGTNLFGYQVYMNKTLRIPLEEVKVTRSEAEGAVRYVIDAQSLQKALSTRFSDIKIVALGEIPDLELPDPGAGPEKSWKP